VSPDTATLTKFYAHPYSFARPLTLRRVVRMSGIEMQLLKFDGTQESLLLIPLERRRVEPSAAR
jgi:hypothetical protein